MSARARSQLVFIAAMICFALFLMPGLDPKRLSMGQPWNWYRSSGFFGKERTVTLASPAWLVLCIGIILLVVRFRPANWPSGGDPGWLAEPDMSAAIRRTLKFDTLDAAVADAENLLAEGYDKTGQWSLGQCCGHLADWLGFAMDGFPRAPMPIRMMLWTARHTIGPAKLKQYLANGDMGTGKPTMPQSVPAAGGDDAAGVAKLRETVDRANRFAGTPLPSPLFGPMDRDTWVKLNCVHAAHHLSFLVPKN